MDLCIICVHDAFALGDSLTDQEVKKDLKSVAPCHNSARHTVPQQKRYLIFLKMPFKENPATSTEVVKDAHMDHGRSRRIFCRDVQR